ncbi:MAG: hypothetical protein GX677_10375 [Treponema sp.]|nr:hypothetical protein [Treponema sp.]
MMEDKRISEENINEIFKKNKSSGVRTLIARHPTTSIELLQKLKIMKNSEFRNAANENMSNREG